MPEFTITRQINAPVERVWEVLDDFGNIQNWSRGVKSSQLTSEGPVSEGATRHCEFSPMGTVNERIDRHVPNERLTVDIYEASKLPMSSATADFNLASSEGGTLLTLKYSYAPNFLGRLMKRSVDKQMRKGMGVLAKDLQAASEGIAATG